VRYVVLSPLQVRSEKPILVGGSASSPCGYHKARFNQSNPFANVCKALKNPSSHRHRVLKTASSRVQALKLPPTASSLCAQALELSPTASSPCAQALLLLLLHRFSLNPLLSLLDLSVIILIKKNLSVIAVLICSFILLCSINTCLIAGKNRRLSSLFFLLKDYETVSIGANRG
jgi:hypothetical protein